MAVLTLVCALMTATPSPASSEFLRTWAETRRFMSGRPTKLEATPDGKAVLFLRSGPRDNVQVLYSFDLVSGRERELASAASLLGQAGQELTAAEKQTLERQRISARGITSFVLSDDGAKVAVALSGRLFVIDRVSGKATTLKTGAGAFDPRFSPDGKVLGYVRGNEVHALNLATGSSRQVTRGGSDERPHGMADFIAQEEMGRFRGYWWAPDGKAIAYQETTFEGVPRWHLADPMDPSKPADTFPYPAAGTVNAKVRLFIASVSGRKKPVQVRWDDATYPYLATVVWPSAGAMTLVVQNRLQTEEQVLAVDPATGKSRLLFVEKDPAWVNLDQKFPRWRSDGRSFFWFTERNGAGEIELRSATGERLETWVPPEAGFQADAGYDEQADALYFVGGSDPTGALLHRATGPGRIEWLGWGANGKAVQTGGVSKRGGVAWTLTTDDRSMPVARVFSLDGRERAALTSVAVEPTLATTTEYRRVGSDPAFDVSLIRPKDFKAGAKYPVVLEVYGGPTKAMVRRERMPDLIAQWLADQGYIVVRIDGRGTPHRTAAWERHVLEDFSVTAEDQATGLKLLGAQVPELDLTRVGVYGWSFGGYLAALVTIKHPELFRAGIAGAPVTDWRDYDTHYTERYLKLPEGNAAGYERSSLLTWAPKLERPLLIIHGTADDNVYFLHALKLSDALFRAGKRHDFLPLAGLTHMVPIPEVIQREWERMAEFFASSIAK